MRIDAPENVLYVVTFLGNDVDLLLDSVKEDGAELVYVHLYEYFDHGLVVIRFNAFYEGNWVQRYLFWVF